VKGVRDIKKTQKAILGLWVTSLGSNQFSNKYGVKIIFPLDPKKIGI
jgi:hypothetical protein